MAERNIVGFVAQWQRGAGVLLASALVGAVVGGLVGVPGSGYVGLLGFFTGAILAFLLISYLWYSR